MEHSKSIRPRCSYANWRYDLPIIFIGTLLFLGSIALGVGLFVSLHSAEVISTVRELKTTGNVFAQNMNRIMGGVIREVMLLKGLMSVFPNLSFQEFVGFTEESDSLKNDILMSLQWIPRVPLDELSSFESMARMAAPEFSSFQIREFNNNGDLVKVAERSEYYPIYFNSPLEASIGVLGLDLGFEPMRRDTIMRCMKGRVAASAKVVLIESLNNNIKIPAFMVLAPVFNTTNNSTSEDNFLGATLGLFQLGKIMTAAMANVNMDVNVVVLDLNSTDTHERLIYDSMFKGSIDSMILSKSMNKIHNAQYTKFEDIGVADRMYRIYYLATPTFISKNKKTSKWFGLFMPICGALIAFIIILLLIKRLQYENERSKQNVEYKLLETSKSKLQSLLDRVAQEEQKTHTIMNGMQDAVLTINQMGKILQVNSAFWKMFQFFESELEDITIRDIFPASFLDSPKFTEDNLPVYARWNGKETTIISKTGVQRLVSVSVSECILSGSQGESINAKIVVLRDLSDRQALIQSLDKEKEKLHDLQMIMSFDSMMQQPETYAQFKEYCDNCLCAENLEFLKEVLKFKSLSKIIERNDMKDSIYNKFLKQGAIWELNLSKEVVENQSKRIMKGIGQVDLFDDLEHVVKRMLVHDVFRRFQQQQQQQSQ